MELIQSCIILLALGRPFITLRSILYVFESAIFMLSSLCVVKKVELVVLRIDN
jgi:hypothetical protein